MTKIKVLVTGSGGFIGKNLLVALQQRDNMEVTTYEVTDDREDLDSLLREADYIVHLAGVNRPERPEEYEEVNAGLTRDIIASLDRLVRRPRIIFASSSQAALYNPYGRSKLNAEEALAGYARRTGAGVVIFRLPNVFGKWCRPDYNSVVATFCHRVTRGLEISISDPKNELDLVYIDDVVNAFLKALEEDLPGGVDRSATVSPTYRITLGELADRLYQFRDLRRTLKLPDFSDGLTRCLYATYLSHLETGDFAYRLERKTDDRGSLAELLKSPSGGQFFVSRTKPGVTRGHHYHNTKTEKFCVLEGEAIIRFRQILGSEVLTYPVKGEEFTVVDIPPGYTHSIENVGPGELIVLFWASELFDPGSPDTFSCEV
jgi:UDP-2-acetamido-2,6-beta-L-arabino-hexul-4-ose reductase